MIPKLLFTTYAKCSVTEHCISRLFSANLLSRWQSPACISVWDCSIFSAELSIFTCWTSWGPHQHIPPVCQGNWMKAWPSSLSTTSPCSVISELANTLCLIIQTWNRMAANIGLCGTQLVIDLQLNLVPLITTLWPQLFRKFSINSLSSIFHHFQYS